MFTINSKQVAEALGKRHDNLKRTIRTDLKKLKEPDRYYIESTYTDSKHQQRTYYEITEEGCERLSEKLDPEDRELFLAKCKGKAPTASVIYTVKEAAERAGISERTMRRRIASGEIESFKQKYEQIIKAERTMITSRALEKFMEGLV